LANLVEEDSVELLENWENLVKLVDQVLKVPEEKMDQRDQWVNLVHLVNKVFLVLLVNQVQLDHQVPLDHLVKAKLFLKQSVGDKVCLDHQEQMDLWVLQVLLENVELVEPVVQKEVLECQECLEVQVVQVDQVHLDRVVPLELLVKTENQDVNTARMISEKFAPQS